MPRSKIGSITLEEAKARFEGWRRNRKGKTSTPDKLSALAVEVARKEGVSRTSTELSVEWDHLKRHMAAASVATPKAVPPAFAELVALVEVCAACRINSSSTGFGSMAERNSL